MGVALVGVDLEGSCFKGNFLSAACCGEDLDRDCCDVTCWGD